MAKNVVGLFDDRAAAEAAVQDLVREGFDRSRISAVAATSEGELLKEQVDASGSFVGDGASAGITSGAIVGGLLGLLIGAGFLLVPAGMVAAGPITGLIAGSAAGAATGGILGALLGLGIPSDDADIYAEGVRRGGTLLVVQAEDSQLDRVHAILDRDGAVDIQDRGFLYREQGHLRHDETAPAFTEAEAAAERARYARGTSDSQRVRIYTAGQEAPPTNQTVGHAYANNPPGNVTPSGDTTDVANTMGGVRPRYGSLDDAENTTHNR
ncbi:MAG: hypothetical protein ACO1SV_20135 [Fimbriimonas sp.]